MKAKSAYERARDQGTADREDHAPGFSSEQMCAAHGCPNRWSVDAGGGKVCSAHAWRNALEWPAITEQQQRDETDRAQMRNEPRSEVRIADPGRMRRVLAGLANKMRANAEDPKRWARKLKAREEAGESLNERQREAWRTALRQQGSEA